MTRRLLASALLGVAVLGVALPVRALPSFTYEPPGSLKPGSGSGRVDYRVYAPGMRFPIESGPAYANSQVYMTGGGKIPGTHCDPGNFTYPWRDNYCETRSWSMPLCPSGAGHQGQDIRAATCKKEVHWVVAVADATVTTIGSYILYLTADDGTRYDYLHTGSIQVAVGDHVTRGQRIAKVSNEFGGTPTTVHLHFNVMQNVAGVGSVFVPPYMSLVRSYEDLLGLSAAKPDAGAVAPDAGAAVDAGAAAAADDDAWWDNEWLARDPLAMTTTPEEPAQPEATAGCATTPARANAPASAIELAALALAVAARAGRRRAGPPRRSPCPPRAS